MGSKFEQYRIGSRSHELEKIVAPRVPTWFEKLAQRSDEWHNDREGQSDSPDLRSTPSSANFPQFEFLSTAFWTTPLPVSSFKLIVTILITNHP